MNRTWTAALLLALASAPAGAVDVELLSESVLLSDTASGGSRAAAISADGRYVAFTSEAVNLVHNMANRGSGFQVFLYDRATGLSTLVSHRAGAPQEAGNNASGDQVTISANGRFVAFTSEASDLVPGLDDTNGTSDVFLWDRVTGTTALVSRVAGTRTTAATGISSAPVVSANGRFVAFVSLAPDLVDLKDQLLPSADVYLWDRRTGEVLPVSRSASHPGWMADGPSYTPSISADGRFVAFLSEAYDVAAGQIERNTGADAFLWDRVARASILVSHAAKSPLDTGNSGGESARARISADGRFVAFTSAATDLIPRQRSLGGHDAFLWSRETGAISLVSHSHNSAVLGVGAESGAAPYVSADGNWVAYVSEAASLVRNQEDPNRTFDVFLWSRATGKNALVSRPDTTGYTGSALFGLSADGAWIGYVSTNMNQVRGVRDVNKVRGDVFLFERRAGKIRLVSFSGLLPGRTADDQSGGAFLSANGGWVAWTTHASDLQSGTRDANHAPDVVLQSRNGEREIVSLHAEERASNTPQGSSLTRSIDASGRFVLFASTADAGLLVPGMRDVNRAEDLFLYDRQLHTIELITRSAEIPEATADSDVDGSLEGQISADGRWVVFTSNAKDVVAGVRRGLTHKVYLWDRTTGQTTWVAGFFFGSHDVAISADGGVVAFRSFEPALVPGQVEQASTSDIFLYERASGTITLASRANGSATVTANGDSARPMLSADGRIVAYTSEATNLLAAGTTAEGQDVFLFDRETATTTLASGAVAPPQTQFGRVGLDLSGDGRFVLFESHALVPGVDPIPFESTFDLYLFDRIAGTTVLVTHTAASLTTAIGDVVSTETASLSADGRSAAFVSTAANLVPGQASPPGSTNVFVFDRETGAIELVSRTAGTVATAGSGLASEPVISADGRRVAFVSNRLDLVPGSTDPQRGRNLFVHDRVTRATTLVSHSFESPTRMSDGSCGLHVLSADGTVIAFSCSSPDLVPGDFNRFGGPMLDAFAANVP